MLVCTRESKHHLLYCIEDWIEGLSTYFSKDRAVQLSLRLPLSLRIEQFKCVKFTPIIDVLYQPMGVAY